MGGPTRTVQRWLSGGPVGHADVERIRGKLLVDAGSAGVRYARFGALMTLATVIATGGVITDSTATVIGAMIVAPLMTPLMGTAFSTVIGDRRGIARSALVVLAGATSVVALSWALTSLLPGGVDTVSNTQVTGRTTVGLIELMIALASGAVGAFGSLREDVSDALPGVAIAISLVPPLCVVGVCLAVASYAQAGAALLLFATNAVAILIASEIVFTLAGFGGVSRATLDEGARRAAVIATVVATAVLFGPLAGTTYRLTRDAVVERRVEPGVVEALDGSGYALVSIDVRGDSVTVVVAGSGVRPSPERMSAALYERTGRALDVSLEIRPLERYTFTTGPE